MSKTNYLLLSISRILIGHSVFVEHTDLSFLLCWNLGAILVLDQEISKYHMLANLISSYWNIFFSYVFLVKMKVFALVKSSCLNLLESALDFYMSHFGTCDVLPFRIFVHIIVLLEKWQPSSTFFLVLEVSIIATFWFEKYCKNLLHANFCNNFAVAQKVEGDFCCQNSPVLGSNHQPALSKRFWL